MSLFKGDAPDPLECYLKWYYFIHVRPSLHFNSIKIYLALVYDKLVFELES